MSPETWLLVVIALPLLFAAAELIARSWIRSRARYFCWPPHTRFRMPLDRTVFASGDAEVRFDVNRLGERGDAPPHSFDGVYRVLVAGGSAAECYYLDQDSSWPGRLQQLLSRPEACQRLDVRAAHVGNIARSLVPCRAIRYQLEKLLPQLPHSDAALLMVGASDLVTWLEQHTPAQIDSGGYALDSIFGLHPERSFGWKPGQLALRRAAASAQRALLRPVERRETSGKRLAANRAMRAGAKQILEDIADPAPMLQRYEADLREVLRALKRHSKRVVVVQQMWLEKSLTPEEARQLWMFAAGRPYKEQVDAYYAHEVIWPLMRAIYDIGGRVAREEGVEALDLQNRVPRDLEHYYDDMHHTPKGCALVARLIADHLTGESPA
jgi:hypothetical protein